MSRKSLGWVYALAGTLAAAGVAGCMTAQNSTLDAITGATAPYVEAFVEYRGPAQRWAGAGNWVLHVVAKQDEKPEITAPQAWMPSQEDMSETRKPASQLISGEEARAKLGDLASAVSAPDSGFAGCLYPVHVRLIREDGYVVDKQGCRNQSHWAKAASDAVDFFLAAAR